MQTVSSISLSAGDVVAIPIGMDGGGSRMRRSVFQHLGPAKVLNGLLAGSLGSLQGRLDIVLLSAGVGPEIRPHEESSEKVGERGEVNDIEPNGEGLSASVETGNPNVGAQFLCDLSLGNRRELVVDEKVEQSRTSSNNELGDLSGSKGPLQRLGNSDVERGNSVVGVLSRSKMIVSSNCLPRRMICL